jgi:hypothetical protein
VTVAFLKASIAAWKVLHPVSKGVPVAVPLPEGGPAAGTGVLVDIGLDNETIDVIANIARADILERLLLARVIKHGASRFIVERANETSWSLEILDDTFSHGLVETSVARLDLVMLPFEE